MFNPDKIYYEPAVLGYELGRVLRNKYRDLPWQPIESHNNIDELRNNPNSAFAQMKRHIILGVRKTHNYVPNHKSSDFLVPYTSSGCSAACLYCYLVCNYNKCSYLRLFVNREQMLGKLIKTANDSSRELTFEIGSNSDLVLENGLTGNLPWTIEQFGKNERGFITFPTKFADTEPLLSLNHRGRTVVRMSVNPQEIITRVEFGTAPLKERITAINNLCEAGYRCGLLIAPVVLLENWREQYTWLLDTLQAELSEKLKNSMFIEIILMTYSYIHRAINNEAFPNAVELYDKDLMTGRGRGKYCYKNDVRAEAEQFFTQEIEQRFGAGKILYIS